MSTETQPKLSVVDFIPVVRQLAEEMPDFQYVKPDEALNCSNVAGGDAKYPDHPGCIIGQAAKRLGLTINEYHEQEDVEQLCLAYSIDCTDFKRFKWLATVQSNQDGGCPWQRAVDRADAQCGKL